MSCYLPVIRLILKPIKTAMLFIVLSIAATYSTTVNAFGVEKLRLLATVPGIPSIPGIANHEKITARALGPDHFNFDEVKLSNGSSAYFTPQAIHDIQNGNMLTDRDVFTPSIHFDDESFKEGTERLFKLQQKIKEAALAGTYLLGRYLLGESLHSVQDFYAHTTWVEQHGNGIQLAPLGLQSFNGVPSTIATCSPIGIKRPVQLTSGYFSIDQAVVGRDNYDTSNFFDSLYHPPHKCVHGIASRRNNESSGAGINKDNALRDNFYLAKDYAVLATQQFVRNILLDLKDNPKAVCGLMGQKCKPTVKDPNVPCGTTSQPCEPTEPSPSGCTFKNLRALGPGQVIIEIDTPGCRSPSVNLTFVRETITCDPTILKPDGSPVGTIVNEIAPNVTEYSLTRQIPVLSQTIPGCIRKYLFEFPGGFQRDSNGVKVPVSFSGVLTVTIPYEGP